MWLAMTLLMVKYLLGGLYWLGWLIKTKNLIINIVDVNNFNLDPLNAKKEYMIPRR